MLRASPIVKEKLAGAWEAPATLRIKRRRECWAAATGLLLLTLVLSFGGLLEPVEQRLTDIRSRLLDRAPTGQIAIVEIDARSIAARKNWPWPRRHHADLIDRLSAAGASMIAFDVDFSAKSNPADDAAVAEALKVPQPVILPVFQQRASNNPGDVEMIKSRPAVGFERAWIGGVNILPGPDGVVREFPAATMINGEVQPAMAVLLSDNGGLGARTFVPDWSIDVKRIPRFSFNDVIEGRVPAKALAGKRIIVGATAIELGDRYAIPRFGTVPGVVIQALAAESLLQQRTLTRSGWLPTVGGLLVALLLVASFRRFRWAFPLAAGTVFLALAVIPLAVQSRWPILIDTAPLWFALIAAIALRLIVEARYRVRLAAMLDVESALPNERALEAALQEEANERAYLTTAAVDRFETIRSALATADLASVVASAAGRIRPIVGSTIYRVAPDTFAWLTPAEGDPEKYCASIGNAFAEPFNVGGAAVDVSLTFGMAARTRDTTSAQLIERGLAAMTDARTRGVTRQWFRGVGADTLRDLSLMGELRRGIDQDQLFIAYQPKLDLKGGNITHAEALVRWRHPTEGMVPPDRFLPLAEETGVVREITRFVLRRVMEECHVADGPQISVSVNISAADVSDPEFARHVIRMLADTGFEPALLTLEITESAIIRSRQTALQVLEALRDHGIRLSIDDYGTGQSTLSYLKTLPVHELKIDKMFVTRLCEHEGDLIMVRSTIDLAHQLGLSVVAEGTEDWTTIGRLAELGCDYAQGFGIGRGMSFEELRALAQSPLKRAA